MADFDQYKIAIGDTGDIYPNKYNGFVTATEAYATEIENAREGESNLVTNLQSNYISYTLSTNVSGDSTYKCTSMADGVDPQDYITKAQADSISGAADAPSTIALVGTGGLSANDILVVNSSGSAITGRPTNYSAVPVNSAINGSYAMNVSGGAKTTNLPAGVLGAVISYADVGGNLSLSNTLTITAASGEKIMGSITNPDSLIINDYPFCSFDLVYISAAFGWLIARFQR